MMRMKVVGDLGQVLFCPIELGDEDSIRRAVAHSNIVINCIGRGFDTMNFTLEDVNITGPARIARICKEMGVERFINFSHINARQNPEAAFLPGGSRFLRTKKDISKYKYKKEEVISRMICESSSDETNSRDSEGKFLSYGTV